VEFILYPFLSHSHVQKQVIFMAEFVFDWLSKKSRLRIVAQHIPESTATHVGQNFPLSLQVSGSRWTQHLLPVPWPSVDNQTETDYLSSYSTKETVCPDWLSDLGAQAEKVPGVIWIRNSWDRMFQDFCIFRNSNKSPVIHRVQSATVRHHKQVVKVNKIENLHTT
jgi:hypothetical protein